MPGLGLGLGNLSTTVMPWPICARVKGLGLGSREWKTEIGKWKSETRSGMVPIGQCLLFCLASNWHRYSTMIYITTVYTCACTPISAYQSMWYALLSGMAVQAACEQVVEWVTKILDPQCSADDRAAYHQVNCRC